MKNIKIHACGRDTLKKLCINENMIEHECIIFNNCSFYFMYLCTISKLNWTKVKKRREKKKKFDRTTLFPLIFILSFLFLNWSFHFNGCMSKNSDAGKKVTKILIRYLWMLFIYLFFNQIIYWQETKKKKCQRFFSFMSQCKLFASH